VVFVKRILNDELGERKVLDQIKEEEDEIMK
jgi:hypothetical protein